MFKDFEIKNGGHFFWVPPFDRGFGGDPLNFSKIFFYQKLLINIIEKVKNFETMFPMQKLAKQAELGVPHSEIQVKQNWELNWHDVRELGATHST